VRLLASSLGFCILFVGALIGAMGIMLIKLSAWES